MPATLYSMAISHPAHAARRMLELKGIEHRLIQLPPGSQPVALRLARFRGGTVPALELDGRRIQGSLAIARALEAARPDPPLFGDDPDERRAIEEAERWGESELQNVPRRAFRWALAHSREAQDWFVRDILRLRPVRPLALGGIPLSRVFAAQAGATDAGVQESLARLPALLDRVDALLGEGVLGGDRLNAADLQIGTSVAALAAITDLRPLVAGRPVLGLAERTWPDPPFRVPPVLPAAWLPG